MPPSLRFLFAALLLAPLAGCASGGVANEGAAWTESALRDHLRQLADPAVPADSALAARRTLYAARRMRAAGLMPAREPSFLLRMGGTPVPASPEASVGPTQAHVLGYVVGRHPSHSDELVLVAADLNSAGAAAVLETARVLAQEARYTQTPERSVLFALWAPPRTGAQGLSDFLANPTWALPNMRRVLLVVADSGAVTESRRRLEAHEIPAEVVVVDDRSMAVPGTRPDVWLGVGSGTQVSASSAPVSRVTTAGIPRACASVTTIPHVSLRDGCTSRSVPAQVSCSAAPPSAPGQVTRASSPRSTAMSRRSAPRPGSGAGPAIVSSQFSSRSGASAVSRVRVAVRPRPPTSDDWFMRPLSARDSHESNT